MKEITEEISKMMFHGQVLIEEKAHLIHGLKNELRKTSEHFNKFTELKEMGKREAEMQYKMTVNERQAEYEANKKNLEEQYEHLLASKDDELKKFMDDATRYTMNKK